MTAKTASESAIEDIKNYQQFKQAGEDLLYLAGHGQLPIASTFLANLRAETEIGENT